MRHLFSFLFFKAASFLDRVVHFIVSDGCGKQQALVTLLARCSKAATELCRESTTTTSTTATVPSGGCVAVLEALCRDHRSFLQRLLASALACPTPDHPLCDVLFLLANAAAVTLSGYTRRRQHHQKEEANHHRQLQQQQQQHGQQHSSQPSDDFDDQGASCHGGMNGGMNGGIGYYYANGDNGDNYDDVEGDSEEEEASQLVMTQFAQRFGAPHTPQHSSLRHQWGDGAGCGERRQTAENNPQQQGQEELLPPPPYQPSPLGCCLSAAASCVVASASSLIGHLEKFGHAGCWTNALALLTTLAAALETTLVEAEEEVGGGVSSSNGDLLLDDVRSLAAAFETLVLGGGGSGGGGGGANNSVSALPGVASGCSGGSSSSSSSGGGGGGGGGIRLGAAARALLVRSECPAAVCGAAKLLCLLSRGVVCADRGNGSSSSSSGAVAVTVVACSSSECTRVLLRDGVAEFAIAGLNTRGGLRDRWFICFKSCSLFDEHIHS
jgi:hypothetical protein